MAHVNKLPHWDRRLPAGFLGRISWPWLLTLRPYKASWGDSPAATTCAGKWLGWKQRSPMLHPERAGSNSTRTRAYLPPIWLALNGANNPRIHGYHPTEGPFLVRVAE